MKTVNDGNNRKHKLQLFLLLFMTVTCIPDRYGVLPAVFLTLRGLTWSIPDRSRAGFVTLNRYQDRSGAGFMTRNKHDRCRGRTK